MLQRGISTLVEPATVAVFAGVLLSTYLAMSIFRKKPKLPPGPMSLPIVGNLIQLMFGKEPAYVRFRDWTKNGKYDSVILLYIGTRPMIVLNDYEVVKEALVTRANDFANRPELILADVLTDGKDILFGQYGDVWRYHRKVAFSAMRNFASGKTLEKYTRNAVTRAIDKIREENGKPFNIRPTIASMVYNLLSSMCFGIDVEFDDPELNFMTTITKDFLDAIGAGFVGDFISYLKYFPDPNIKKTQKLAEPFLKYLEKNLKEHQSSYDRNNLRDMCDYLLYCQQESQEQGESSVPLTDTHLIMTLFDVYGASIDTLVTSVHNGVAFAAQNPETQSKMQGEIENVVGQRSPAISDRKNLPYTEAFFCETLRKGTLAVLGVPLATACDTTLKGYDILKDTMVMINFWALHNDPDYWDEPEQFRPSRFLDEQGKLAPKPPSYMPFSGGRRVCLGEQLAKTQLMVILPMLFQQLTFCPPDGKQLELEMEDNPLVAMPKPYLIVAKERS